MQGARRLRQDDVECLTRVKVPGVPEECLAAAVVLGCGEDSFEGRARSKQLLQRLRVLSGGRRLEFRWLYPLATRVNKDGSNPREGARSLAHVRLRVVADPEREQLRELTAVVLVGRHGGALFESEVPNHQGVVGDGVDERPKIAPPGRPI